jgi:hypothetical protein
MMSPGSTSPPDRALLLLLTTPGRDESAGLSAAADDGRRVATAIIEPVPTARARRSLADFLTFVATMSSSSAG